jgi:uncharacterized repeat protein (TIGR02059 family)
MALLPNFTISGDTSPMWTEVTGDGQALDSSWHGPNHTAAQTWIQDAARAAHGTFGVKTTGFKDEQNAGAASMDMHIGAPGAYNRANGTSMVEGDEEWVGCALWFPTNFPGTGSWGNIWEFASGHSTTHPRYGTGFDITDPTRLRWEIKEGLHPDPGTGNSNPILPPNGNGYNATETLLGPGGPPSRTVFTKGVWHYFIRHTIFRARSPGVAELWHMEQGGSWAKLYSNKNDGTALINRLPHPTWYYNDQFGAPGEGSTTHPRLFIYRVYRGNTAFDRANDVVYWADGFVRRQSFQQVVDEFGGSGVSVPDPPDPAAGHLRIGNATPTGGATSAGDVDTKRVIKRGVGAGNTVAFDQGYQYEAGPVSGGVQVKRMVVYDDDGANGLPGSRLGMSDPITLAQGAVLAWVSYPFSTPVVATGDQVYIGMIYGGPGTGQFGYTSITGQGWRNTDTYSDGPSNPFGINPTVINIEPAVVLDYTLTGDTVAPVFQFATVQDNVLLMAYDEGFDSASVPATSDFVVTVNLTPWGISNVVLSNATVQLTLSNAVAVGDIVTIAYTQPGSGALQDLTGNKSASLSQQSVSNVTVLIGGRVIDPTSRVAIARRIDVADRRAGEGGGL